MICDCFFRMASSFKSIWISQEWQQTKKETPKRLRKTCLVGGCLSPLKNVLVKMGWFIFPNFPGWKLTIIELNPRPSCYCCPSFKIYKSLCFPDLLPHKGSGAIMGCHEICRDLKFSSLVEGGSRKQWLATGSDWNFVGEYILSITMKKILTCGKCSFLRFGIIVVTNNDHNDNRSISNWRFGNWSKFFLPQKGRKLRNLVPTWIAWRVWRRFTYPVAPEELPKPNRKGLSSNFQSTIFQGLCLLNFGGVPVPFQTWT